MADDYDENASDDENEEHEEHIEEGESLIQPLTEDHETPFSPPTDPIIDPAVDLDIRTQQGKLDPTHPVTDAATNLDPAQLLDEALSGASEASEPNAGNAVVGYDPSKDQRKGEATEE
jgi:hypothetical protein